MIDHLLQSEAQHPQRKSLKKLDFFGNQVRINFSRRDTEEWNPESCQVAANNCIESYLMENPKDHLTDRDCRTLTIWDMVPSRIHVLGIDWNKWRRDMLKNKTVFVYCGSIALFGGLAVAAWQQINNDTARWFVSGACLWLCAVIANAFYSTAPFRLSIEGDLFREARGKSANDSLVFAREEDFSSGAIDFFIERYGIKPADLRHLELTVCGDYVPREGVQRLVNHITLRRQALDAQARLETQAGLQSEALGYASANVIAVRIRDASVEAVATLAAAIAGFATAWLAIVVGIFSALSWLQMQLIADKSNATLRVLEGLVHLLALGSLVLTGLFTLGLILAGVGAVLRRKWPKPPRSFFSHYKVQLLLAGRPRWINLLTTPDRFLAAGLYDRILGDIRSANRRID